MQAQEVDTRLDGAEGIRVSLTTGQQLTFTRQALLCEGCFRQAILNQTGYTVPEYTPGQFDEVVRVLIELSYAEELAAA